MIVAGIYSFNGGQEVFESAYPNELAQVMQVINQVDSESCKTKESKEKTTYGNLLYSPSELNTLFKNGFTELGWKSHKIYCHYPTQYYVSN